MSKFICRISFAVFGVFVLSGCAESAIKISADDEAYVAKQSAFSALFYRSKIDIMMSSQTTLTGFGLVGHIVGSEITRDPKERVREQIRKNDPAKSIMISFLKGLKRGRQTASTVFHAVNAPQSDDVDVVAATAKEDLVWDFKTVTWLLRYHSFSWNSYFMDPFKLRARLISKRDSKVLWQGICSYPGQSKALARDASKVFEGDAVKDMLADLVSSCVTQLLSQYRG